jgi:hypothetical protein
MTLCKGEDSLRHRLSGLIRGYQHGSESRCDAMTAQWSAPFCHCDDCEERCYPTTAVRQDVLPHRLSAGVEAWPCREP